MPTLTQYSDRREFGRRSTVIHSSILITGRSELPCVVRNLSQRGALLELKVPSWLPFLFRLRLADGTEMDCEMRHKGSNGVGVLFTTALSHPLIKGRQ